MVNQKWNTNPSNEINWPLAPVGRFIGLPTADRQVPQVHLWATRLDVEAEAIECLSTILSRDELERAAGFHFEHLRMRFTTARAFLRKVLASWLEVRPDGIEFAYSANGKPALGGRLASRALWFNLAHSQDLALLAVTQAGPVGVDVEQIRCLPDFDELVARFFSPRESNAFQRLTGPEKTVAFFNLWTRKEAWLKATGQGIGHLLNRVEVSFLRNEPARFLSLPQIAPSQASWAVHELRPAAGFAAALAIAAEDVRLHCWQWDNKNDCPAETAGCETVIAELSPF